MRMGGTRLAHKTGLSSFDDACVSARACRFAWSKRRSAHKHRQHNDIGHLVQQLVRAEDRPISIIIEIERVTLVDLLLGPIDVVMHEKLSDEYHRSEAASGLQGK